MFIYILYRLQGGLFILSISHVDQGTIRIPTLILMRLAQYSFVEGHFLLGSRCGLPDQ